MSKKYTTKTENYFLSKKNLNKDVNIHINFIKTLYNFKLLANILFIGLFDNFTPYRPRSIRICFFCNLY